MFHVGQKVVCVNVTPVDDGKIWAGITFPVKGTVYTVRGLVGVGPCQTAPGILVEEIVHPVSILGGEPNFAAWRFRPVVERKTDISIFKELLTPTKILERI